MRSSDYTENCCAQPSEIRPFGQSTVAVPTQLAFEVLYILKRFDESKGSTSRDYDSCEEKRCESTRKITLSEKFQACFQHNIDSANAEISNARQGLEYLTKLRDDQTTKDKELIDHHRREVARVWEEKRVAERQAVALAEENATLKQHLKPEVQPSPKGALSKASKSTRH